MNTTSLKFAQYWRSCLVDAERNVGKLAFKDLRTFIRLPSSAASLGVIPREDVAKLFAEEAEESESVEVSFRPFLYAASVVHGVAHSTGPAYLTPLVTDAILTRDGLLWPQPKTQVPRDILEPLDDGSFAISTVALVDSFMSQHPPISDPEWGDRAAHSAHWATYLDYVDHLMAAVFAQWSEAASDDYHRNAGALLYKAKDTSGSSKHIVAVYEDLLTNAPEAALYERWTALAIEPPSPCLTTPAAGFSNRLAHSHSEAPLAIAQRDALTHFLACPTGDILAINGPPGTGKTTLLLSVIATLWARAALAGPDSQPPVIVASSTNNQAVTNILDAFEQDFSTGEGALAGRWIPQLKSFGTYLPSFLKQDEADAKYQTSKFFTSLEVESEFNIAKQHFLKHAATAFPQEQALTVESAVALLHQGIRSGSEKLQQLESSWIGKEKAERTLLEGLNGLSQEEARSTDTAERLKAIKTALTNGRSALDHYFASESFLLTLFSMLPAVRRKRLALGRAAVLSGCRGGLSDEQSTEAEHWAKTSDIETSLKRWEYEATRELDLELERLRQIEASIAAKEASLVRWASALQLLGPEFSAINGPQNTTLETCDVAADTAIRFPIFQLATHYWEGRWLLEMEQNLGEILESVTKKGRRTVTQRWHRWMKLTPCVVTTLYMLPDKMSCSRKDNSTWKTDYLYQFADLLIIDEAGQVLPEVAGAAFTFAQKALVIGDTQQIEPIASINMAVDKGNLAAAGLMTAAMDDDAYEQIAHLGLTAAKGSAMRVAQNASRFHYDEKLERGMYLYEHRRCFDSIIEYCNQLCYQGKLQPKRGAPEDQLLPFLGYLHVPGICISAQGGSRENVLEAETIAAWLAAQRTTLAARYGKDLSAIVAIVTPFAAQVRAIEEACRRQGISTGKGTDAVTVGTIHSLQGAARRIVIFSSVYSKHSDGKFIDQRNSMLNVAVSRAQDSFLVFGDMDQFSLAPEGTPRAKLAKFLFESPSNALDFTPIPREDLVSAQTGLRHLHNADEHDQFLLKAIADATHDIHIVSPWLNINRVMEIGALDAMVAAVARNVSVHIYTDLQLNAEAGQIVAETERLRGAFRKLLDAEIRPYALKRVHSKLVMSGDDLLCVGSFNWFSASRSSNYARHETSMVYRGPDVADEISAILASLHKLKITKRSN